MAIYYERLHYTNIKYLLLLLVKYFKCRRYKPTRNKLFILLVTTHQQLYRLKDKNL